MNYILLATEKSLEEVLEQFKGHVTIFHIGEESGYTDYIKDISLNYLNREGKPIPKLIQLNDLRPSLRSVYFKGNGFKEVMDKMTGEIINESFEDEDYIKMNSYYIVKNPAKMACLYMLANQVYNGDRPLVFTCTDSEDADLLLTHIINHLFINWFKILPVSIYELMEDPAIMQSLPEPKFKTEVNNFIREYKTKGSASVNLRDAEDEE